MVLPTLLFPLRLILVLFSYLPNVYSSFVKRGLVLKRDTASREPELE